MEKKRKRKKVSLRALITGLIVVVVIVGAARLYMSFSNSHASTQVMGYGLNLSSQLGGASKLKVSEIRPLQLTKDNEDLIVSSVHTGAYSTFLLSTTGEVYALGSNNFHTVSANDNTTISKPVRVEFPGLEQGETITQMDSSRDHAIALTSKGRVYTWGSNYTAQLGDGTNLTRNKPVHVQDAPEAVSVAAGYRHSAVIATNGEVYAWGGSCTSEVATKAEQMVADAAGNITALSGYGSTDHTNLQPHGRL